MKIAIAMSGGVDSSMAALLLKEAGHDITGITAELSAGIIARHYGPAAASSAVASARSLAEDHGFPLHVVNLEDDFTSLIVEPFCAEYLRGATPNPCVSCNALIKFGRLLDRARALGCEAIATGHYALIRQSDTGRYYVARGRETAKDQSYFLYRLSQESMKRIIFPLGGFTKDEVLRMAVERRLPVAERPESQEICFIPDNRYDEFIERAAGRAPAPGDIVDTGGAVIGRHRGIHRYTIGQRRGLGIAAPRPLRGEDRRAPQCHRRRVPRGPGDRLPLRRFDPLHEGNDPGRQASPGENALDPGAGDGAAGRRSGRSNSAVR